jgi:hypothetical protein
MLAVSEYVMVKRWSLRRMSDLALLMIVIFLVLSTWGPPLLNIDGFYVPEIVIIPLIFYLFIRRPYAWNAIRRCMFSKSGLLAAAWLVFAAILGILLTGSVAGPYSELRASLILVYAFVFMYKHADQQANLTDLLFWTSFAVLCLDSLLVLLQVAIPGFLSLSASNDMADSQEAGVFGLGRVAIPAISILVSAYLSSRAQRIFMLFFIIILGGILSLGGHRVILLTTAISTLFVPLCMLNISVMEKLKDKWLKALQIFFYVCLLAIFFQSDIIQNYLTDASGIQYRLFTKTADTLTGVSSGLSSGGSVDFGEEGIRAAYFSFLIEDWPWLLLPHGLGSREVAGKLGDKFDELAARFGALGEWGNTHDLAILYMAYHHGLLITGSLVAAAIFLVFRRLRSANNGLDRAYVLTALMGIVVIDLAYPPIPGINIACIYGLFLGLVLNHRSMRAPRSHFDDTELHAQI